jgi:AcrR family transcriptional regulator
MSPEDNGGLRERRKRETREALSAAALRLALEHGPQNVRVDDIAEAAGVSPRTYNNYFSSREQAIVAAIAAERALRIGAAVRARPAGEPLAEAVIEAVVEQYGGSGEPAGDALRLITLTQGLRTEYIGTIASLEQPVAAAIVARTDADELAASVLAAAVSAAVRVAVERWLRPMRDPQNQAVPTLLVPQGPLADLLREALSPLAPALEAAGRHE